MSFAQRTREIRGDESQEALAKRAGVSQQLINRIESGGVKESRKAALIAAAAGVNVKWLLYGEGPKYISGTRGPADTYTPDGQPVSVSTSETPTSYVRLPHYAAEVSAGEGFMLDESGVEVVQFLDVAKWWAEQHLPRDLSRIRVLTVRGDSMTPDMHHGDLLFVDASVQHFEDAGLYVLHWNGRALVKRLSPELRSGRLAITSSNPAYPTEYVEPGELSELHIGGRVAAWWSLRKF